MILLKSEFNSLIIIRHKRTFVPELVKKLNEIGVGISFGIIDILSLETTIPRFDLTEKVEEKKQKKITERITLQEIEDHIVEGSKPSFNYFLFIILSAIIAGIGLLQNSSVILIASMILSPLMGPILGFSFGIITKNRQMIKDSSTSQIIGLLISISIGILLGVFSRFIINNPQVSSEMAARTFPNYFDVIIAICAGIAVGFCISGSVQSSLVGMAIALSLMPPAVNVGLALMYLDTTLSIGSLILLITNILIINLSTIIVFKLKKINILPSIVPFWKGPKEKFIKEEKKEEEPKTIKEKFKKLFSRKK